MTSTGGRSSLHSTGRASPQFPTSLEADGALMQTGAEEALALDGRASANSRRL
eukprot:CAMPEP_0180637908 /NCGR_PEP_ID=MMETSP1037_2-20121125/43963_1 /TAXON_ID=632150 /ORGANISM="Azadinium spinosum, Strain 3D9" /LENGTH=52 /DNA_ID=CAMNT_0022659243 /DNA_START=335 /DNA_END=493 /DNA_ORIENTATION=+